MGAIVPECVADNALSRRLRQHLRLVHRGKVRDTYEVPGHPDKLFVVATDRVSIFDFVLGALVPQKGEVLVALTIFWLTEVLNEIDHHLLAYGSGIDAFLPLELIADPELQRRAVIVKRLHMVPVECIARGYLTGSGWKDYRKDQAVCGIALPADLHDGSQLPSPIFTPSTKAIVGHDVNITAESVELRFGSWLGEKTLALYRRASEYARSRGIIIADTKLEFGTDHCLGDEAFTPDSSRFWGTDEYQAARLMGRSPTGYDKEPVRQAGKLAVIAGQTVDISQLDPTNETDVALAAAWQIPGVVVAQTTQRYLNIVSRLTGTDLETFQQHFMHVVR